MKESKLLIIGDTHFGAASSSKKLFDKKMEYFKTEVFPLIKERGITSVIQLGDLFHSRGSTDNYILYHFQKEFRKWFEDNQVHLYSLIGNHDTVFKNTRTPNIQESVFKKSMFCHSIVNEDIIEIEGTVVHFVPWIIDPANDFHDYSKKVDFAVGHFALDGALMEGTMTAKEGMNPSKLKEYNIVFSGHFHSRSNLYNIVYTGTPYQLNWAQYATTTGIYEVTKKESGDISYEFIENKFSPKYLKFYYVEDESSLRLEILGLEDYDSSKYVNDILHEDILKIANNNIIKIIVKEYSSQNLLETFLSQIQSQIRYGKLSVINEIDFIDINDQDILSEISEDISIGSIITQRVNQLSTPADIDTNKLNVYLSSLFEESEKESQGNF